jgi:hypothetical protein
LASSLRTRSSSLLDASVFNERLLGGCGFEYSIER